MYKFQVLLAFDSYVLIGNFRICFSLIYTPGDGVRNLLIHLEDFWLGPVTLENVNTVNE